MEIKYFRLNLKTNQVKLNNHTLIPVFKFFPTLNNTSKYFVDFQNERIFISIKFNKKIQDILKALEVIKNKIEIIKTLNENFSVVDLEILFNGSKYNIFIDSSIIKIYDEETLFIKIKDWNNDFNLLTKILNELIKKDIFLNHAISHLSEVRNNLFLYLNEDKLNCDKIEEIDIYIESEDKNIEIENRIVNLQILTNININNKNKILNHILKINHGHYYISLKYFPDLISDLVNSKFEIHLVEDPENSSEIGLLLICNNRKYLLRKKIQKFVIENLESGDMIFSCTEHSGFIDIFIKIGMINILLRNKDIILSLFEKYKSSLYDKMLNFIDNILSDLNNLKY